MYKNVGLLNTIQSLFLIGFELFETHSHAAEHLKLASKINIIFYITNIFIQKQCFVYHF